MPVPKDVQPILDNFFDTLQAWRRAVMVARQKCREAQVAEDAADTAKTHFTAVGLGTLINVAFRFFESPEEVPHEPDH